MRVYQGGRLMKIGLLYTSNKANEKRYPVHIKHVNKLRQDQLHKIVFEKGYPGIDSLKDKKVTILKREEVFKKADLVILPKPERADYKHFKENQILWGWPHCVQTPSIVDVAIKKKMTLIAWEHMFAWESEEKGQHVFHRNNELAGYASVIHGLTLAGMTAGSYGNGKKVAVIGYGSTGKGAIKALLGLGAEEVNVYSQRSRSQIKADDNRLVFKKYHAHNHVVEMEGQSAAQELSQYDIIVNCILQNPLKPKMFITNEEARGFSKKTLIIDVSCDEKMGFEFARPTSFDEPIFQIGKIIYYGVNHSPSYFFEAASYEISKALFPHLQYILDHDTFVGSLVLEKAVDIERGIIHNANIISYQNRESKWPYLRIKKR
jgi:alanine dehydrogenase